MISDGFQLAPGRELSGWMAVYFPNVPEWRLGKVAGSIRAQFLAILQLAAKKDVVIYAIDSRGLEGPGGAYEASSGTGAIAALPGIQRAIEAAALESSDPLRLLASATGGTFYHNSNDLVAGLKGAFADAREYYLLAYVPKNANLDGKFRTIHVEVRDNRLKVRSKPGYWATAP